MWKRFVQLAVVVAGAQGSFASAILMGSNGDISAYPAADIVQFPMVGGAPPSSQTVSASLNGVGVTVGGILEGQSITGFSADSTMANVSGYQVTGQPDASFTFQTGNFTLTQPDSFQDAIVNGPVTGLPVEVRQDANVGSASSDTVLAGFGVSSGAIDDTLMAFFGPITVVFDSPVSAVRGLVGSLGAEGSVRIVAYDNNGDMLAVVNDSGDGFGFSSTTFSTTPGESAFGLLGLEDDAALDVIKAVAFYLDGMVDDSGFGLRGLTFQSAPDLVPAPASISLLLLASLLMRRGSLS